MEIGFEHVKAHAQVTKQNVKNNPKLKSTLGFGEGVGTYSCLMELNSERSL